MFTEAQINISVEEVTLLCDHSLHAKSKSMRHLPCLTSSSVRISKVENRTFCSLSKPIIVRLNPNINQTHIHEAQYACVSWGG